ncbi:hypothetical protein BH09VER1_BH09VER1_28080 [soil metagenome]
MQPLRGLLIDSARCLESRKYYRDLIRFAAERGMNTLVWHFTDDQGCTLQFDAAPEAAGPNAYSKAEMKALVRFARSLKVTLIPELESLGHSRYLTRHPRFSHLLESEEEFTAICPVAEETRAIMRALLGEIAEIFDSPYIHVGLDEVKLGGNPMTKKALRRKTERELLADYAIFLHGEVTKLGRRMIMWGDRRTRALDILRLLPRDIIVADWEYSREVAPDQVEHFLALGFDVLLCPALITYDQPFLAGERLGTANVRSMSAHQTLPAKGGRVLGIVTTMWTPTRYLHDAQWFALALGAEIMRDEKVSIRAATRRFLAEYHGVSPPPSDLIKAWMSLSELAPVRDPYLSLLRGERLGELDSAALRRDLAGWLEISEALGRHRTLVRRQHRAWDTMRLAVSFVIYLHRRGLGLPGSSTASGKLLLERLRSTWNRERFFNDPRKSEVAFRFDRAEHLLLSFADSLA